MHRRVELPLLLAPHQILLFFSRIDGTLITSHREACHVARLVNDRFSEPAIAESLPNTIVEIEKFRVAGVSLYDCPTMFIDEFGVVDFSSGIFKSVLYLAGFLLLLNANSFPLVWHCTSRTKRCSSTID